MNIDKFIKTNFLEPGDVIVSKKRGWNILSHTISYLGQDYYTGQHLFAANMTDGVRIIEEWEIDELQYNYRPEKLKRFVGSEKERQKAVNRALSKIGENKYHILFNNCEHYTNYVQHGKVYSRQEQNFGLGVVAFVLLLLVAGAGKRR